MVSCSGTVHCAYHETFQQLAAFYVSRISDWTAMSLFMNVSVLCMPKSISTYEYHTKKLKFMLYLYHKIGLAYIN